MINRDLKRIQVTMKMCVCVCVRPQGNSQCHLSDQLVKFPLFNLLPVAVSMNFPFCVHNKKDKYNDSYKV